MLVDYNLDFNQYQLEAAKTAVYGRIFVETEGGLVEASWLYPALGLGGESGEVLEKLKKIIRDTGGRVTPEKRGEVIKELGDVLWYLARIAHHFDTTLGHVAITNLAKLAERQTRGVLHGNGDSR